MELNSKQMNVYLASHQTQLLTWSINGIYFLDLEHIASSSSFFSSYSHFILTISLIEHLDNRVSYKALVIADI